METEKTITKEIYREYLVTTARTLKDFECCGDDDNLKRLELLNYVMSELYLLDNDIYQVEEITTVCSPIETIKEAMSEAFKEINENYKRNHQAAFE